MKNDVKIKIRTIVLDCSNAQKLADFYAKLLGWNQTVIDLREYARKNATTPESSRAFVYLGAELAGMVVNDNE